MISIKIISNGIHDFSTLCKWERKWRCFRYFMKCLKIVHFLRGLKWKKLLDVSSSFMLLVHFYFVEWIFVFSLQWNDSMSKSNESFKLKNIANCSNMKWDSIWSRHISFDFLNIWFCEWNTWNVRRKKVYLWCRFRNALIYISYRTCVIVFQANKPNESRENPENKNPLK